MAENTGKAAVTVVSAAIGTILVIAIVSVVVGKNAQTPNVIKTGGSALASIVGAAVAPVSGASASTLPTTSPSILGATNGATNGGFTGLNTITSGINGNTGIANALDPTLGNQDFSSADSAIGAAASSFVPDNALIDSAYAAAL